MNLPTKSEIFAFGRNVVSGITPLIGLAVAFGALSPDQQTQILASVNHIKTGVHEIGIGIGGLLFLGPLISGWFAKLSSSPKNQVKNAQIAVNAGTVEDVAIIPTGPKSPINNPAGDVTKVAAALAAPVGSI